MCVYVVQYGIKEIVNLTKPLTVKVTGCLCVSVSLCKDVCVARISVTAEPIWFSFKLKLLIGPEYVYQLFMGVGFAGAITPLQQSYALHNTPKKTVVNSNPIGMYLIRNIENHAQDERNIIQIKK